jgi:hypothetical protein
MCRDRHVYDSMHFHFYSKKPNRLLHKHLEYRESHAKHVQFGFHLGVPYRKSHNAQKALNEWLGPVRDEAFLLGEHF